MKRFKNILYVAESAVGLKAFHHAAGLAERNKDRLLKNQPLSLSRFDRLSARVSIFKDMTSP